MTRLPPPLIQALKECDSKASVSSESAAKTRSLLHDIVQFYESFIDDHLNGVSGSSTSASVGDHLLADGLQERQTTLGPLGTSQASLGPTILEFHGVSCSLPMRKKCQISFHSSPAGAGCIVLSDHTDHSKVLHQLSLEDASAITVLILGTPFKPNSFNICLIPTTATSAPTSDIMFTLPDKAPLLDLMKKWSIPVLQDDTFRSSKIRAKIPLPFLECRTGVKDAFLYPLATGLFVGFKKPLVFIPHSRIVDMYTKNTMKTGSLVVVVEGLTETTIDGLEIGLLEELDKYLVMHRPRMGVTKEVLPPGLVKLDPGMSLAQAPLMESDDEDGDFVGSDTEDETDDAGDSSESTGSVGSGSSSSDEAEDVDDGVGVEEGSSDTDIGALETDASESLGSSDGDRSEDTEEEDADNDFVEMVDEDSLVSVTPVTVTSTATSSLAEVDDEENDNDYAELEGMDPSEEEVALEDIDEEDRSSLPPNKRLRADFSSSSSHTPASNGVLANDIHDEADEEDELDDD